MLRAVPTFVLVLLLYVFLKKVFFNPLEKILHQRFQESEGAMNAARAAASEAEKKRAQYEQALKEARTDIYRIHERERQKALEESAEQIRQARLRAEERLRASRQQLQSEVEEAKAQLAQESAQLADSITHAVLRPRAETAP